MFKISDEIIPFIKILWSNLINEKTNNRKYDKILKIIIINIFMHILPKKLSLINLSIKIINKLHKVNVNVLINNELVYAISYNKPIMIDIIINL